MRGDLVFEKLGEIDPELVADALPNAMPLMSVSDLRKPPKPPRGTVWRKMLVIAACILLAGLLAVGGGVWLFREGAEQPWETDTIDASDSSDTQPSGVILHPDGSGTDDTSVTEPSRIEGAFRVYDITGSQLLFVDKDPAHARAIEEIMAILNRATEPTKSMIESPGNFQMMIGDTTLIPNHGTLYNRTSGKTYAFSEGDWDRFHTLIREIVGYFPNGLPELAGYITYEHVTRHPRDAYSLSVTIHNPLYTLKSLTLVHESADYSISMEEDFWGQSYICTIPEDAPFGKYTAYASFETLYDEEADAQEYMWKSVMTVAEHEKEPAYTFAYDWAEEEAVYHYGDTVSLYASLTNLGDDLYRYGSNTVLHPKAELRIRRGDETLSFKMTDELISEDGGLIRSLASGRQGESGWYTLLITEDMPGGMYDLVLSFEGHEKVIENVLEINDTLVLCRGDSYGLFVSQAEPSTFVLRQGDYEIPFSRWDNLPVVTIPADAPAGSYDLVENGYLSFEGFLIVSDAENEHFSHNDLRKQTVQRGDWVEFDACVNVKGATIHAFMPYDSLDIEAVLVSIYGSPTSYTLTAMGAPDAREPNNYTFYPGETIIKSKTFIIPDDMPAGVYDLVVTFRGETKTYPKMITVVAP
ncbi:MAG: hypothetical protein IKU90_06055 [Clostridia bacterium]|nr:hypothetical protein [Clostridia bacterium]